MMPVLLIALLFAGELDGQPMHKENAASLLKTGVELRRKGDHEGALQRFREAHEIAPCGQTFVQMGLAEQSLQRWVDSEEHLSRGINEPDDWVRKYRQAIDTALTTVRAHIGTLEVSGPAGAQVAVDGKARASLPMKEIRLNEGSVSVSIQVPGQPAWSQSLSVGGGAHAVVVAASLPTRTTSATVPTTPVEVPRGSAHDWHDWFGGLLIGAGLVAAGFGTYALIKNGDCSGGAGCPSVFASKPLGWTSVGAGAAAVLTGSIVLFTGGKPGETQVACGLSPSGMFAQGRF